jgi:hypothetical protein
MCSCPHVGTQPLPVASSNGLSVRPRSLRSRSSPIEPRPT